MLRSTGLKLFILWFAIASVISTANAKCSCVQSEYFVSCQEPALTEMPSCANRNTPELSIWFNSIPIQANTLQDFTNLDHLDIGYRALDSIPDDAFRGNAGLRYLGIHNTTLKYLSRDLISYLPLLETLYLEMNRITTLADDSFTNFPKLHMVLLNDNLITRISPQIFDGSNEVSHISLTNNPLHCDCELLEAYLELSELPKKRLLLGTCEEPSQLRGQHVDTAIETLECDTILIL